MNNRLKKLLSASFTMVMAISVVLQSELPVSAEMLNSKSPYSQSNPSYHYFYNQLSDESKRIYEAMEEMYEKGIFAKGEDYDLSKNGKVTDAQLKTFVSGSSKLIDDYGAARDAFQYDYPDVFYVDFSLLTVRVVMDSDGILHGYLGAGRSDTYLLRTFTKDNIPDAVDKYEKAIEKALSSLPTEAAKDETLAETQTLYIHDYLVKNMIYHFEHEVSNGDCNSRTAYDALVYGEGVCEAYTRGFKALMDRAGIPTVCVYGVYRPSEQVNEMHIWNYVRIDGKWYGVDITHDDPVIKGSNSKNSGKETREFLLVGELDLAHHHIPSGIMSTANYEFAYPKLSVEGLREVSVYTNGDLVVKLKEDYYEEDSDEILKSGTILVSYKGKNYTQNAKDGYYILSKYGQYYPESDEWSYSDWAYITPQYYDVEGMEPDTPDPEMGYYVNLPLPHIMKAQFAVTTIAPSFKYENGEISGSLYYEGNPALLTVVSEEINNKWGTYVAPPYPAKVSPGMTTSMKIGATYHIKVVYDDDLKEDDTGASAGIKLSQESSFSGGVITGQDYSRVENVTWDNERTIEFDFTPSKQYADNNSYYSLQVTGLIGVKSGKKPVPITYSCAYGTSFCALGVDGFNWKIFGQPQLLDTSDIDTSDWTARDMATGEKIGNLDLLNKLTNRLTLVTQEPAPGKAKEMTDMLESEFPNENFLTEKTYNIQLTLCKCMVIQTGQGIRVCVGFPAGYDYSSLDKGVTYKAYHYKVNPDTNQLTGEVEEIRCFVTQYGLIIECDSFSPFTIAAVKADGNKASNKTVMFQSDANGAFYDSGKKLEGHDGFIELTPTGAAKEITVKANENYVINEIVVGNQRLQLDEDTTEHTIRLDYSDYNNQTVIVSAEFISSKVQKQDAKNGFSNVLMIENTINRDNSQMADTAPNKPGNTASQDDTAQESSGSDNDDGTVWTGSGTDNSDNQTQPTSNSINNDSSMQVASAPDNKDHLTQAASTAGDNAVKNKSTEQTEGENKKVSVGNEASDSSSGGDSSIKEITITKLEPDNIDSASASGVTGVYDGEDEYVEIDAEEAREENVFMFIIIAVAAIGIVAVGCAVVVLRKNREW